MTGVDVNIDRSPGLRRLAYAPVVLATLAGLFAMHGLPMTMPSAMPMSTAMPMSSSVGLEASPAHTSVPATAIAMGDTSAAVRMRAVTERGARVASASSAASPMAGVHGGCDAEHGGCLATLRGQPHSDSPTSITLGSAAADPTSLVSDPDRAGRLQRAPPPPRPCLTELCISRT